MPIDPNQLKKGIPRARKAPPAAPEAPPGVLGGLVTQEPLKLGPDDAEEEEPTPPVDVKFITSLKLNADQEKAFLHHVEQRIEELMQETGLQRDFGVRMDSFLGIRMRNMDSYDCDLGWRVAMGGIFEKSNFSLGTNTRHTRYISARVQDDLLGTEPFFAAIARRSDKEELAKQAEQYVQNVVSQSAVRAGLRRAQKNALIVNESVVRISWVEDKSPFKGPARVYVDATGKPVITAAKKLYIYENDNFLPSPVVEGAPDGTPQVGILEKDPSFTMKKGEYQLANVPDLDQTLVLYQGPKAEPLDARCFLCSLRAPSIHEADMVVHLYRETPLRLKEQYGGGDIGGRYFSNSEPTGDKQPKASQGEKEEHSSVYQETTVAEVFIRHDADGDGVAEEIWIVIDLDCRERANSAVFYDYLGNHYKKRPFEVVPGIETVPNRWYGRGIFSLNYDQELHIDAEFNRAQVRGSKASTVLFRQQGACVEWDSGLPVVIGGDDVLTCGPQFDAEKNPPIFAVNLANENKRDIELMEISRQAADAKVGAISVKDASQSDLNQSKTATGIVNLQAASDVITKATEIDQMEPLTAILGQVVDISLEHMDATALILDKDATELITLNREEIRSLPQDIRLTLTKSRSSQMQAVSQQKIGLMKDYRQLMLSDPEGAKYMRQAYIDELKALEASDADELCPEITQDMIDAFQQRQAPQQPPSRSISAKITDLAPSERAQLLLAEGIKPASPEELAQMDAKNKADEAAAKVNPNHEPSSQRPAPSKPAQPNGSR